MERVDERAEVGPLTDRIGERHRIAEQGARFRGLDLEIRMHDDGGQAVRNGQAHDIGRARAAHEHEAAVQTWRDVVGMCRPRAQPLAFERARQQRVDWKPRADQGVHRHDRRDRARGAAAEAARQRQPFRDRQIDAAVLPCRAQQRLRGDARAVPRRLARQPSGVAGDVGDANAAGGAARRHLVARRFEREAEHVESTRDVGDRRGREGGHRIH